MLLILFTSCVPGQVYAKTPAKTHPIGIIHISGGISEDVAKAALKLTPQAAKDKEWIVIVINSPGGSVDAGMEIIKMIESLPVKSVCVVEGEAASMGGRISQACTYRIITKRSSMMIHEEMWTRKIEDGQPTDYQNVADAIELSIKMECEQLAYRMHATPQEIRNQIRGARWWLFGWEDAWKWGLVDIVVERSQDVINSLYVNGVLPDNLAAGIPQLPDPHQAK